jgi:hypothetical protein
VSEAKEKNKKNKEKDGEEIIVIEDGTVYDKKNKTLAGPDGEIYGEFL